MNNNVPRKAVATEHQRLVLKLLRSQPGISRSELIRRTGLGKATISQIVSRFIEQGLLCEDGAVEQSGVAGRPPVPLRLNDQYRLAIGVELTGAQCVAALLDMYSTPLRMVLYPLPDRSVQTAVDAIGLAVQDLLRGHDRENLLGIGVGVPGMVGLDRQTILVAVNPGWFNVPLGALLHKSLQIDTIIVNRQAAGALGEYWHGVGCRKPVLLYVSIGVGIGSGILINGLLFQGATGSAGEIGHTTVLPAGARCRCGSDGCLEAVASCSAMVARAKQKVKEVGSSRLLADSHGVVEAITSDMLFTAAMDGDRVALDVVEESAGYVGLALAGAVNIFNPSLIVVGGDIAMLGEVFLAPIREAVRRRALSVPGGAVTICGSMLGDRAAVIGAGSLAIDRLFSPPMPEDFERRKVTFSPGTVGRSTA